MSTQERLTYLLAQALHRSATEAELLELSTLIRTDESGALTRQLESMLLQELREDPAADYDMAYWDGKIGDILSADRQDISPEQEPEEDNLLPLYPRRRLRWIPAAAAAVLFLSVSLYWLLHRTGNKAPALATSATSHDIAPGTNKALLTLADGTEIPVDTAANGVLTQQGTTSITQVAGGQLLYSSKNGQGKEADITQFNILRTPRGGQFQLRLPDGTRVWLNAASALKYPVAFHGPDRRVELTGEAYFEVAPDAGMPFKVTVRTGQYKDSMEVAVLGTQFNIMAYPDETMVKTTLLEGAVKVISNNNSKQLAPGQGALLDKQHQTLRLQQHADTEEAVAWKNGFIQLEGNDMASIMRMIARWYDVEVLFTADVPAHFRGAIPKNVPVSQVLKMMEMTGEVHFEIRGNQIVVSP